MRLVIATLAVLVGCSRPADRLADPSRAGAAPSGPTKPAGRVKPGNGGGAAGGGGAVVLPAVGCPAPTCAFHAGAAAYFTCLDGGAGACFHFGGPCTPPDACMFDPADRTYKHCGRPSEGACQQWGPACAPATKCMFDVSDGLYRTCDDIAGGACKRYGALCAP